ncbi:MAG: Uma2 family endonuclease [Chloroflexi bacterium]|nr:Uma2 family endonuclease [Chloroflexota bacterium]
MAATAPALEGKVTVQWTLTEFLSFEETAKIKHQLVAGKIYNMAGGTRKHSRLVGNTFGDLFRRLGGKGCFLHTNDMLVRIDDYNAVYPDMSVVCGDDYYSDDRELALLNPTVVVEVTSPSTITDDRGWKLELYKSLPSLRACLIIDQHRIFAELHTRAGDSWLLQTFDSLGELIPLAALNIELPLAQVYADVAGDLALE